MSADDERHAIELRVQRARTRLHDRFEGLEQRGKRALHTAAVAVEVGAMLIVGLGALSAWLVFRAARRTTRERRHAQLLARAPRAPRVRGLASLALWFAALAAAAATRTPQPRLLAPPRSLRSARQ